jgi:hypothetical protein
MVIGAFITMLAAYSFWPHWGYHVYDIGMAIGIMLLVWSIHLSATGWYRKFSLGFLVLCMSNVVDEFFFDPTEIQINEYIAASLILLIIVFEYKITEIIIYLKHNIKRWVTRDGLR